MADEDSIDLKVNIQPEVKQTKFDQAISSAQANVSALKNAGAFTGKDSGKLTQINTLINALKEFSNISNPNRNQLLSFQSNFTQLSKIISSVALQASGASKELNALGKALQDATDTMKNDQSDLDAVKKKGRFDYENKNFTLYKSTANAELEDSKIFTQTKSGNVGRQIKSFDTLLNYIQTDEQGNPKYNADGSVNFKDQESEDHFAKPSAVQKYFKNLYNETQEQEKLFIEINNKLVKDAEQVNIAKQNLEQGQKSTENKNSVGSQIYTNQQLLSSDVTTQVSKQNSAIQDAKNQKEELAKSTQNLNGKLRTEQGLLGRAFKAFTFYAVAMRAIKEAVREAVSTITELDKSLTEQAMVTGMTRDQAYENLKAYQDLAFQLGATTKEVAESVSEFLKQGKSMSDSMKLTEAAVSASKVSGVSASDSIEYLTTALNGFNLSADQAMEVSDKFAAIAAASASDYDEIAVALSKVASQANLAGMSIDYTTSLLTKALETTREAPESIGTALKTIIARMRELTDYGKTLDDSTDLNTVQQQLAYVGISLTNANGELRSTQDVLDELGKKWDTLNGNQQAALANALAGTRQQSRLIAMMSNYQRVIELEQISERSAGATSAQASVYLEGMTAATNNIRVAWEELITTITNSQSIINVVNTLATGLTNLGTFLSTGFGQFTMWTGLVVIVGEYLAKRRLEFQYQKDSLELQEKERIAQLQTNQAILDGQVNEAKTTSLKKQNILAEKKKTLVAAQTNLEATKALITEAKIAALKKNPTADIATDPNILSAIKDRASALDDVAKAQGEVNIAQTEANQASDAYISAQTKAKTSQEALNLALAQQNTLISLLLPVQVAINTAKGVYAAIMGVINLAQTIHNKGLKTYIVEKWNAVFATTAHTAAATVDTVAISAQTAATNANTAATVANNAAQAANPTGLIITGIIVGLAALAAAAYGIYKWFSSWQTPVEKAADSINDLSDKIYTLTSKANDIKTTIDTVTDLDNKLIKTAADGESMSDALSAAADKLTDDEKDVYNNLVGDQQKIDYLQKIYNKDLDEANDYRQQQLETARSLSADDLHTLLTDTTSTENLKAQSAFYAMNNQSLYNEIDALKKVNKLTDDQAISLEGITQTILENLSATDAYNLANQGGVDELTDTLSNLQKIITTDVNGDTVAATVSEILDSDDYGLEAKVKAFQEIEAALSGNELEAFNTAFQEYDIFSKMDDSVLKFIEDTGMSVDNLNSMYATWEKLQAAGVNITQQQFEDKFPQFLEELADENGDIQSAIMDSYGEFLDQFDSDNEQFIDAYNILVNSIGDTIGTGILNMGQNMEDFENQIQSFYEKASSWSTMSESERAKFISNNGDLFSSAGGDDLLQAFESGNYSAIESALENNEALQDLRKQRLADIDEEIKIEEAKRGDARNEAYIAELKDFRDMLSDEEDLYSASLKTRLEQQNDQLSTYKDYLSSEEEQLKSSLETRKDAYNDYFDAINKEADAEDYEEKAQLLQSNLVKLGSSTNAASLQQTAELQGQLEDLEKERQDTLRKDAQQAVLDGIDDSISAIDTKFSDVIDNQQKMLQLMQQELSASSASTLSSMITSQVGGGATALQLQDYLSTLENQFGSLLPNVDWSNIKFGEDSNNNLVLNVNGQEINLGSSDQQTIYAAIMRALTEVGLK